MSGKMSRKIELASRNEGTREANVPNMHIEQLNEIKIQFDTNIESIKDKFTIADLLKETGNEEQVKDIYRSQVVFLESALDYYIHSLSIYAMIQMYNGNWEKTSGYKQLKIPVDTVIYAIEHPEKTEWMKEAVVAHHRTKTYMNPSEIKGQFTLVGDGTLFREIAKKMYYDRESNVKPEDVLKQNLNVIFERRNQIAHQADRKHETGDIYDICEDVVRGYIDTVSVFVANLHDELIK